MTSEAIVSSPEWTKAPAIGSIASDSATKKANIVPPRGMRLLADSFRSCRKEVLERHERHGSEDRNVIRIILPDIDLDQIPVPPTVSPIRLPKLGKRTGGMLYPFLGILLSPVIAAVAMALSCVSAVGTSLRLRRISL